MEALLSAAVGEVFSRCLSFLINKYTTSPAAGLSEQESLQRLERALLRVAITVEEADGRFVTNTGMLQQLKELRKAMYRGYYVLDRFKYLDGDEAATAAKANAHPGKRRRFPPSAAATVTTSTQGNREELELTLDCVQNMAADMHECVAFVRSYPPMFRQPYSMHLVLERCMFGRHAEMERTIRFLLQREPPPAVGVLPIIGRGRVGKSTLVEHVCHDVRVRQHFSQIVLFGAEESVEESPGGGTKEKKGGMDDGGVIRYENSGQKDGKLLVVIELDRDVEEGAWRRQLSAATRRCRLRPGGSKIIVTSRSERAANLGTTEAIRLDFFPREACWYFFKVLLFGSACAEDQPKLASIAMEIFEEYYGQDALFGGFTGSHANSKNIAALLKANASAQHWRRVLACVRWNGEENLVPCSNGGRPNNSSSRSRPGNNGHYNLCTISNMHQYVRVDRHRVVRSSRHEEVPKVTVDEVMYGRIAPKGKFEAVLWTSHLPPYYSYIANCEILDSRCVQEGRRCSKKRKEVS
jgi:hypothetical protein